MSFLSIKHFVLKINMILCFSHNNNNVVDNCRAVTILVYHLFKFYNL